MVIKIFLYTNSKYYKVLANMCYYPVLVHPPIHNCLSVFAVNNFQTITEELVRKQESLDQSEELARMKEKLNMELHKHDNRMNKAR